jgi:transcriptional regulator with XRE-family HTH domain
MAKYDVEQLCRVLRQVVQATRYRNRQIEDAIGLGHGTLSRLLSGDLELRVHHLLRLAEFLDVPPGDFFELAYTEESGRTRNRLADWTAPLRRRQTEEPPAGREDLRELIRETLREEIAALRRGEPDAAGGSGSPSAGG